MMRSFTPLVVLLYFTVARGQLKMTIPSFTLGYLSVPGANLYYETIGSGPLLLFISGGNGDADIWRQIAYVLASNFTVAIYDRRGYSRSYLSPVAIQDYSKRLETDVNDAAFLIQHLSEVPGEATVLGTSSGAIVALELLVEHPELLGTLISHEAPAITVLPDRANLTIGQTAIYDTYRKYGIPPALVQFGALYASQNDTVALIVSMDTHTKEFMNGNNFVWFERELLPYPLYEFDLDKMSLGKSKLMLANGVETNPQALHYRANVQLATMFGLDVNVLPGGHVGYREDPQGWAIALVQALVKRAAGANQ
ncbi:Alpha/Beta hydrolase protein [Lophiotrema nucula]|uniref:Alpha/Beta hydrolase protein n=1 Tax=Lophiotrema nucula TaxID=690887 RepID=A0A6A5YGS4_9PLEO|nr:Alpha/Beta hydrolase protein [Lophiotrema nucula]